VTTVQESLDRLLEQKAKLDRLRRIILDRQAIARSTHWFERIQAVAGPLAQRWSRQAQALIERHARLAEAITAWQAELAEKSSWVAAFRLKQARRRLPLLVSRARKRPIVEFLREKKCKDALFALRLMELRQALARQLEHHQVLQKSLEDHSVPSPSLFEPAEQRIWAGFEASHQTLMALREPVLGESVPYESARLALRRIEEAAAAMRCVEDVYRRPASWWRRIKCAAGRWRGKRGKFPPGSHESADARASGR
jgi:hypothetical protein